MEYEEMRQQAWLDNNTHAMKIFELADDKVADVLDDLVTLCNLLRGADLSTIVAKWDQPSVARILGLYGES